MFAFSGDQRKKRPSNGQTEVGWDLPGMVYSQPTTDYSWYPQCQFSSHRDPPRL